MGTTITGIVYLDMFQQFLNPQLDEDDQEGCIHFQQERAPPHYLDEVREYLNTRSPGRWKSHQNISIRGKTRVSVSCEVNCTLAFRGKKTSFATTPHIHFIVVKGTAHAPVSFMGSLHKVQDVGAA
jgi:hypothetical protein